MNNYVENKSQKKVVIMKIQFKIEQKAAIKRSYI